MTQHYFFNLKYGNLSLREIDNIKKFYDTLFEKPDFSLLY